MFSLCFFLLNWAPERVSATQCRHRLVLSLTPTLIVYKKMIHPGRPPSALRKSILVSRHMATKVLLRLAFSPVLEHRVCVCALSDWAAFKSR